MTDVCAVAADLAAEHEALDFCLVVTQRRHVDDSALRSDGDAARHWVVEAQAFAGGATDGPPPGGAFPTSPNDPSTHS